MLGLMVIGYGTADGCGWVDTGLFRLFLMPSGFTAAGHEAGVAFAAALTAARGVLSSAALAGGSRGRL